MAVNGCKKIGKCDHFSFRLHVMFIRAIACYLDISDQVYAIYTYKTDTSNLANIL